MMSRILITGANRGIGLEFARQYVVEGWSVIGTARDLDDVSDLKALGSNVEVKQYDASDDRSLDELAKSIGGTPLDAIIANSGYGGGAHTAAGDISLKEWVDTITVNTAAPFLLAVRFQQNLAAGNKPKLVGISSLAASIGSGYDVPGQYVYRASKAGMNALWRNLSVEWHKLGITCLVMRPGRVKTRMTNFTGDLDVVQSVSGMKRMIDQATIEDSGKFYGYDGKDVPW